MAADDLNAPLGQAKKRSFKPPVALRKAIAGTLGLFLVAFVLWALINDNPFGGEPMVVALVETPARDAAKTDAAKRETAHTTGAPRDTAAPARPGTAATPPDRDDVAAVAAIPPGARTVNIIDGSSGKRRQVVLPAPGGNAAALDQRLTELTHHGLIPKTAPDGARPAEVYAQTVKPLAGKPNAPRIAIVLGGLGIDNPLTATALGKLPGAVTFAVKPYGHYLDALVKHMRSAGHEVLLQVPMEPFDYPDNDPGPHTLLTALGSAQNVDRLHWLMSRFQGYVGIVNQMGARFTARKQAIAPVMREVAARGLIYFDDGSSPRSLAGQIAGTNNLPFVRADVVIDTVATPAKIDRALERLATIARQRGLAVGMAHALPASIDRIGKWANEAAKQGLLLVPISTAVSKAKAS